MEGQGASLTPKDWQERVTLAMRRQHMSTRKVVAKARTMGLKVSNGTLAEAMTGKIEPHDRIVAAYSLVLGIHPDELGFTRSPLTELAYLAFEGRPKATRSVRAA
jgi:lambda repressor-like predicted transcriptional regulator